MRVTAILVERDCGHHAWAPPASKGELIEGWGWVYFGDWADRLCPRHHIWTAMYFYDEWLVR